MYPYYGITDIGYGRTNNEDYILLKELDNDTLLAIICDGAGSHNEEFQPAALVANEISMYIKKVIDLNDINYLLENLKFELQMAYYSANRALGLFKIANEEKFGGFAACVTCCILNKNVFAFASCGNTRMYLLRDGLPNGIRCMTIDETKGQKLVDDGVITKEQYYTNPDRLKIESALGMSADINIQVFVGRLKEDDKILLTTDGIHYAIREDIIAEVFRKTSTIDEFCNALISLNKEAKYIDNCSAIFIINKIVKSKKIEIVNTGDNKQEEWLS